MARFRILVADELSEEGLAVLSEAGDVTVKTGMDQAMLRDALPGIHALVVRSATKVPAGALERADQLAVIGRAGIGVDSIDVQAATAKGIVVMNTPEAGMVTTGEHAVALMMSLARNIAAADASMKAGRWDKKKLLGTELRGKTLGILGLGRIGSVVAARAQGLKMQVIAHDPAVDARSAPPSVRLVSFEELLAESDFVSVHVPLTPGTRHMLGRDAIAKMKPGARLIHAARGGVVDEDALCDALESGHLAGAAIDVFETEPLPADHRLRSAPHVILTPHLGASTAEAKRNVSLDVARQVATCLQTGVALNGVNVPRIHPAHAHRVAPFLALARNLSTFLVQVFPGKVESLRLTVQGELLTAAAEALEAEVIVGALQRTAGRPVTPVNASKVAEELGLRLHTETSPLKRDFVNLVRIEALLGGERHTISGTVLGRRHGRMVELDDYILDAIPEGPLLVTFHEDRPGVIGSVGTLLGEAHVNVARLQLGAAEHGDGPALGILNLSDPIPPEVLEQVQEIPAIRKAYAVECAAPLCSAANASMNDANASTPAGSMAL